LNSKIIDSQATTIDEGKRKLYCGKTRKFANGFIYCRVAD